MVVRIFVEELAGPAKATIQRRGPYTAILVSPTAWAGDIHARVELLNRLIATQEASGPGTAIPEQHLGEIVELFAA